MRKISALAMLSGMIIFLIIGGSASAQKKKLSGVDKFIAVVDYGPDQQRVVRMGLFYFKDSADITFNEIAKAMADSGYHAASPPELASFRRNVRDSFTSICPVVAFSLLTEDKGIPRAVYYNGDTVYNFPIRKNLSRFKATGYFKGGTCCFLAVANKRVENILGDKIDIGKFVFEDSARFSLISFDENMIGRAIIATIKAYGYKPGSIEDLFSFYLLFPGLNYINSRLSGSFFVLAPGTLYFNERGQRLLPVLRIARPENHFFRGMLDVIYGHDQNLYFLAVPKK
jgi:hypothetical protein